MRIGLAPLFMSLLQKDGCSGLLRALISGGVGFWEGAQLHIHQKTNIGFLEQNLTKYEKTPYISV